MAQQLSEKTKLLQDDPSIIHCTVKNNQRSLNKSRPKIHSANVQNSNRPKEAASFRPKSASLATSSSKTQKEKKSEPVNIDPKKSSFGKNSNYHGGGSPHHGRVYRYPYQGYDFYHHPHPHHFGNSQPPKPANSSSSSSSSSKKVIVNNHVSAPSKSTAKPQPVKKTGTPIDGLMHGKLAPTFNKVKTNQHLPSQIKSNPLQALLKDSQLKNGDRTTESKTTTKIAATSVNTIRTPNNKSRITSASSNDLSSSEKNQHDQSVSSAATERKNNAKAKKKQNKPKPKKNKSEKAVKANQDLKQACETKSGTSSDNLEAGRRILDLVNGTSKIAMPRSNKENDLASYNALSKEKVLLPSPVAEASTRKSEVKLTNETTKTVEKDTSSNSPAINDKDTEKKEKVSGNTESKTSIPLPNSVKVKATKQLTEAEKKEAERLERLALEQAAHRLKKDHIILLKKAPNQHPKAKFFCKLCIYHMDTIALAHRHIKEKRHKKNFKDHEQEEFLRNLVMPNNEAISEIETLLLDKVLKDKILDDNDLTERKATVKKLDNLIRSKLPRCKVVCYGSSLSGLGFKNSDVNVDLQYPKDMKAPTVLLQVLNILNQSDTFVDVKSEFHGKLPRIDFVDEHTQLRIQLSTGNELAIMTSRLLLFYAMLDERVKQLTMVLRTWARMCKLDLQHDGALSAHSFPIMAIFFMQTRNYLPVLHENIHEWDLENIISSSLKCPQLQLNEDGWWYLPTPPPDANEEAVDRDSPDDSNSDSDYDTSFTVQETTIDLTYLSNPEFETLVIQKPGTKVEEQYGSDDFSKPVRVMENCVGSRLSLAALWLNLMRFYAVQFPMENEIINICSSVRMKREDKKWSKKRIGMLDPYATKRNLCRSLNTQGVYTYFMNRLKSTLVYFFQPVLRKTTNDVKKADDNRKNFAKAVTKNKAVESCKSTLDFAEKLSCEVLKHALPNYQPPGSTVPSLGVVQLAEEVLKAIISDVMRTSVDGKTDNNQNAVEMSTKTSSKTSDVELCEQLEKSLSISSDSDKQVEKSENSTNKQKYSYEFSLAVITGGKFPVKVCGLCKKEGHPRNECPDETKTIKLVPLLPVSNKFRGMLDRICYRIFDFYVPTPQEIFYRDNICKSLSNYLQFNYNSSTCMNLFGSSRNGFGFRGSDLDICMTFDGDPTAEKLDCVKVIEEVAKQLRKNKEFYNILPITTAKVPIVKFFHRESGLEGDISLYNLLAQRNTSMLRCYSLIDMRCKVLGYVMKAFVKLCNIGDASRGSLSSYAYTLMVIFYLQQKKVPVLPVLQEICPEGEERRKIVVDGWDSWYYSNLEKLPTVWDGYNKNRETVGELWLGLLRFYTEEFKFKHQVVSIRQKKALTTFEKEWTSKFISIEDPFDLNHNLAAGVSHKMATFIFRVFVKAREHFGTKPKEEVPREVPYFFDPMVLTDGEEAPNDRCCRICGKIGHYVRDCPKNRRNKRQDPKDGSNAPERISVTCFLCGEEGHIKKDCPAIKRMQEENENGNLSKSPSKNPAQSNRARTSSTSADSHQNIQKIQATHSPQPSSATKPVNKNRAKSAKQVSSAEAVFPRSLPTDLKIADDVSSEPSRRLFQRKSESEGSPRIVTGSPISHSLNTAPSPSHGPQATPQTPPASFKICPSTPPTNFSNHPLIPPSYFGSSPGKGKMEHVMRASLPYSTVPMRSPRSPQVLPPGPPPPLPHLWRYPVHVPLSPPPRGMTPLSQVESQLLKNSPAMMSPPRGSPMMSSRPLSDPNYLGQQNLRSVHPGPPPSLPLLPGFNVTPRPLYPIYSESVNSDVMKDSNVTSPTRHQDLNDVQFCKEET